MKIVILAAGYAVRLHPLTLNTSKSLLEVGKRKIIERILDKVSGLKGGPYGIYIVTNAKFFGNFDSWLKTSIYKERIAVINDGTVTNETRLGAIQDIDFVLKSMKITDDVLIIAGDNLFDFDLNRFLEFGRKNSKGVSVALYDIKSKETAKNFGVVKTGRDGRVVDFEEKPENPKSTLVSCGIYYFPKEKLPLVEEYVKMRNKLDAPGYYIGWLSKVDKVYGFTFLEDWYDIGNIDSYGRADREYKNKERAER
jgi:glucose-1-phosphate thymidylyltransferase